MNRTIVTRCVTSLKEYRMAFQRQLGGPIHAASGQHVIGVDFVQVYEAA